ncbi:T9SS type A sorting domain-containing protein [Fulvivirgaceae bacterium BMA10]|uniref:T9SS type A sorting domain-containing protein n=1 Tax=Splendidivirga corallicola TaxID=3051826 RepID=A0ABT8KID4_9BACT|nr:T9SS type A sorting domain-containing protein [Fulvivirgaceae bacterium BMA10]
MKAFFSILAAILLSSFLQAQSLEIIDSSEEVVGVIGTELRADIKIRNISDKAIFLKVRRVESHISTGEKNYLCLNGDCFDASVDLIPRTIKLDPNETIEGFASVLEAGIAESESRVKYIFYDRNNPNDAIEYEQMFKVLEEKPKSLLLNNKNIQISNVYPNPIHQVAFINYQLLNREANAKIVIHNVLGSIVGEYALSPFESRIKIETAEFNPGVYFYTLYLDNDNILTKKFIKER